MNVNRDEFTEAIRFLMELEGSRKVALSEMLDPFEVLVNESRGYVKVTHELTGENETGSKQDGSK